MERHLARDLDEIKRQIVEMASLAQAMIHKAVQALAERRPELTDEVFVAEKRVNSFQIEIDEHALRLLATQQPVAQDLRLLVSAMKINSEIERIADQAVNISENTRILLQQPPIKPILILPLMAEAVEDMVRESLDAFVRSDVLLAEKVIMADDKVDAFKDQVFRELLTYMMSEPATIPRAITLILISRNLERIGDQATNIGEEVIYMAKGIDVRHPKN